MVGGTTVGPAISIHALREEGDLQKGNVFVWVVPEISIHALREEGDPFHARFRRWKADFYPRPPRGGRLDGWNAGLLTKDISIHALREEGDPTDLVRSEFSVPISIHALREEGDTTQNFTLTWYSDFYPRPPRGGRLRANQIWDEVPKISIHALREEGDLRAVTN